MPELVVGPNVAGCFLAPLGWAGIEEFGVIINVVTCVWLCMEAWIERIYCVILYTSNGIYRTA